MTSPVTTTASVAANFLAYSGFLFFFIGGTLITLLVSVFDVTRRTAVKLFAGCLFGGVGGLLAGMALQSWSIPCQLAGAGIAAVMTENIIMGCMKASKDFAENPFATVTQFIKDILPSLPGTKK